jgi:probable addiction module antidote protein
MSREGIAVEEQEPEVEIVDFKMDESYFYDKELAIAFLTEVAKKNPEQLPGALGKVAKVIGVTKLSKMAGLPVATLNNVFKKSNPTYRTLLKIMNAMGIGLAPFDLNSQDEL